MTLRIIGGLWKGRLLKAPKTHTTRPTLALVRKAVFDIVQFDIQGATVLDLFAGSGAMGIEALSRGAAHATFVDNNRSAISCLTQNLHTLGAQDRSSVLQQDALLALKKLQAEHKRFSFLYIDPPYARSTAALLSFLDTSQLLTEDARLFVEEAAPGTLLKELPSLHSLHHKDTRRFGAALLHHFHHL